MKEWITPSIEFENIKDTAAGGGKPTKHDGFIWENKVKRIFRFFAGINRHIPGLSRENGAGTRDGHG